MKNLYFNLPINGIASCLTALFISLFSLNSYGQCTNIYSYGSATAPTAFNSATTISTCSYQEEYSTLSSVVAQSFYECAISAGGYITIHQGSYNGAVVAHGSSPLIWQAPSSGTYYAHWNTNSSCGTASSCVTTTITRRGCTNSSSYGSATAPTALNTPTTISTCSYYGEYSTISSVLAYNTYRMTIVAGGYITVHSGSYNGPIVAFGPSPLEWQASSSGTYYAHWNNSVACGALSSCQTTQITRLGCTNSSSYGSATAPTACGSPTTISTCSYQSEYSTVSSIVSGSTYSFNISAGGFITVHQGSYNGTVVASGISPLTWVAPSSGTYYPHWNTNTSCGQASGCVTTTVTRIGTIPADPTSVTASSSSICSGDSVTLTVSGADGVVYWFSGSCATTGQIDTGASITVSPTSTTTYYARNNGGCYFSANCANATVTVNPSPSLSMTSTNVSCNGGSDGEAIAAASGGTTPYSYAWANSASGATNSGLIAGTYIVTVTDNNGCEASDTVIVEEPTALVSSIDNTIEPLCNGDTNGAISVSWTGGVTPYSYAWSNGSTSAANSGIGAGSYAVTVTDNNGCLDSISVNLDEPAALITTTTFSDVTCDGDSDGSAMVSASGGIMPYGYLWDDANATDSSSASGLSEGTYIVVVTDSNGCESLDSVLVGHMYENPVIALDDSMKLCAGFEIVLDAGVDSSYYAWSTTDSTQSITVDSAGAYTVTVTNVNGCSSEHTVIVFEEECLGVNESFNPIVLNIYPNPTRGLVNVSVNGIVSKNVTIEVMNMEGQRILVKQLTVANNNAIEQIDLSNVAKGIYLMNFTFEGQLRTHRVIVQ